MMNNWLDNGSVSHPNANMYNQSAGFNPNLGNNSASMNGYANNYFPNNFNHSQSNNYNPMLDSFGNGNYGPLPQQHSHGSCHLHNNNSNNQQGVVSNDYQKPNNHFHGNCNSNHKSVGSFPMPNNMNNVPYNAAASGNGLVPPSFKNDANVGPGCNGGSNCMSGSVHRGYPGYPMTQHSMDTLIDNTNRPGNSRPYPRESDFGELPKLPPRLSKIIYHNDNIDRNQGPSYPIGKHDASNGVQFPLGMKDLSDSWTQTPAQIIEQ